MSGGFIVLGADLVAQQVQPIDIAVVLDNFWLFDNMQYNSLTEWLEHWKTQGDAASSYIFVPASHQIQGTCNAANGDSAQAVSLSSYRSPASLTAKVFFFRMQFNRASGGFFFMGFITGNIENSAGTSFKLDALGDSFAFFTDGANWQAMTQDGSSAAERTVTDTGVTPIGLQKFEMRMTATGVEFFIDNNLVATHTTDIAFTSTNLKIIAGVSAINNVARTFGLASVSASSDRE